MTIKELIERKKQDRFYDSRIYIPILLDKLELSYEEIRAKGRKCYKPNVRYFYFICYHLLEINYPTMAFKFMKNKSTIHNHLTAFEKMLSCNNEVSEKLKKIITEL
jgi:hypothetical protein